MDCLSHRIDPRFLRPLAEALRNGPLTDLEIRALFLRDVPNRNLSLRTLQTLLDLATQGGLLVVEHGQWRLSGRDVDESVLRCLEAWSTAGFVNDSLFQNRCAASLDLGLLSAHGEYTPLPELVNRTALSPVEWSRLVSGPCDIRQLTGRSSKHADADYFMVYRSGDTAPFTDDTDVVPRLPKASLTTFPTSSPELLTSIRLVRASWKEQLASFLAGASVEDFSSFIVYTKDLLDLFFWGKHRPLRSILANEDLPKLSDRTQRFGLRAEDFSIAWKSLPAIYRIFSRLSWGVRYLSNNISHPHPPQPDVGAFLRVSELPGETQAAISTGRSGHCLSTLTRTIRVLYRALLGWRGRMDIARAARECATAMTVDNLDDKLMRRAFALRLRSLKIVPSLHLLDAFTQDLSAPRIPDYTDGVLGSAGLIAAYSQFLESTQGHAYAEIRLSLHAELDFQNRFNIHHPTAPKRYEGVWQGALPDLAARLEETRKSSITTDIVS